MQRVASRGEQWPVSVYKILNTHVTTSKVVVFSRSPRHMTCMVIGEVYSNLFISEDGHSRTESIHVITQMKMKIIKLLFFFFVLDVFSLCASMKPEGGIFLVKLKANKFLRSLN
jgi:hypothetical protein